MVSFQSSYKSAFRLEVPMWHKVNEGVASAKGDSDVTAKTGMAEPVPAMGAQTPAPMGNRQEETEAATDPGSEEGDAEDETYLVPIGQGCFSFQQGLLLRAKETYSKRSIGNKYDIISKWPLTGLAVMITRSNWNILSKHRTLTITPRNLLRTYFRWGYPADDEDRSRKPYALPHPRSLLVGTWEATVSSISHEHYVQATATVTNLDVFGPLGVR